MAKRKALKRGKLNKKIQIIFNEFIRLRDCIEYSKKHPNQPFGCECISCGKWYPYKKLSAGHYISVGSSTALRFDEKNVNAQCAYFCNVMKHGNPIPYRYALDKKYGKGTADSLYSQKDKEKKSMAELREKLEYYKEKVKNLKTQI